MERRHSWLSMNLMYIRAVNSDDQATLRRLLDESCDDPMFFTRRCYIWNVLRGKEFCRVVAEWAIDWYRTLTGTVGDHRSAEAEQNLVEVIHRIMVTEKHENIKRSLVWKITKYAPIITVDTIPYISEERLMNLVSSDRYILTDTSLKPLIRYCSELQMDLASSKAMIAALNDITSN